jgi:hypothetical protein
MDWYASQWASLEHEEAGKWTGTCRNGFYWSARGAENGLVRVAMIFFGALEE